MSNRISVLIPTFNRQEYIKECIQSILNQTYKDFVICVYDDGSTDNTVKLIKDMHDDRIKLKEGKENKGVSFARNKLLEMVDTKYAIWQDSDDLSHVQRLERQINHIKDGCFITSLVSRFWGKDTPTLDEAPHNAGTGRLSFATVLFNIKEFSEKFDERLKLGSEDRIWLTNLQMKCEMLIINKVLYYVRFHRNRIGVWKRQRTEEKAIENAILAEELKKLEQGEKI